MYGERERESEIEKKDVGQKKKKFEFISFFLFSFKSSDRFIIFVGGKKNFHLQKLFENFINLIQFFIKRFIFYLFIEIKYGKKY